MHDLTRCIFVIVIMIYVPINLIIIVSIVIILVDIYIVVVMYVVAMKEKGAGWILNIASVESTTPYPSAPAYATSKWGLRGWSKSCFMVHPLVPVCS